MGPFQIRSNDIKSLNDIQLTQLLKRLLNLDCKFYGINQHAVDVALNITVGDGGEDGRIEWLNGPSNTDFIPSRLVLFQCKAVGSMTPAAYANEIVTDANANILKPRVEGVLLDSGVYIVFTTQELNGQQKTLRINKIREKLRALGKAYADTCDLKIYDASQISDWVNNYIAAIVDVSFFNDKPLINGLKTFECWGEEESINSFPFVSVESRQHLMSGIAMSLQGDNKTIRLTGLSGLGKTRTAYQVISEIDDLKPGIVYIDAEKVGEIPSLVGSWVTRKMNCTIVLDNCDHRLHEQVAEEVRRTNSNITLLSLDYSLEEVSHKTACFYLEPLSVDEIVQLLNVAYERTISNSDIRRIAEFAQGYPQMAVLLAEARLNEDPNIGELTVDHIAEKLIWGRTRNENGDYLKVLRACSLFDWFAIDGTEDNHLELISQYSSVDRGTVYECIQEYSGKIVNVGGRFRQIVPKPLAIRLAKQWWKYARPEVQSKLISEVPTTLVESFCNQISKLDSLDEVKELTQGLCGVQGPFGQAEVILSNKGSRFFRAFVEINPKVTSDSLYRILKKLSDEDILQIQGSVRRNLVWALEMLCFHKSYFDKSIWCLFKLAQNENESFSNNATGQFTQLFRPRLSGTEANFEQRLSAFHTILQLNDEKADAVIIKAIKCAISTYSGSRMLGAEQQGTKPSLEEWKPKVWQEVFDYWQNCFDILLQLSKKQTVIELVKETIGREIRGLTKSGRIKMLDGAIKELIASSGKYWPSANQSIRDALNYDSEKMPIEGKAILLEWLDLLTPDQDSLDDKLKLLVLDPTRVHKKNEDGHYVDLAAADAEIFAQSFSTIDELILHLDLILDFKKQTQSWVFGKELALILPSKEVKCLSQTIIEKLKQRKDARLEFVSGFFSGLFKRDEKSWINIIDQFGLDSNLQHYYPQIIRSGNFLLCHLETFIELIKQGKLSSQTANELSYGGATEHLTDNEIVQFCSALSEIDAQATWCALDNLHMYIFGRDNYDDTLIKPLLSKLILNVSFAIEDKVRHYDGYSWLQSVNKFLDAGDEFFATQLVDFLLEQVVINDIDYSDLWDTFHPAFYKAIELCGKQIWPCFSHKLLTISEENRSYRLNDLLSSSKESIRETNSIFTLLDEDLVIEWCKQENALLIVSRSLPLFDKSNELKSPNELLVKLIINYGKNELFLDEIRAKFNTRSWSGSLVPYLESDKAALEPLLKHESYLVKSWTRRFIDMIEKEIIVQSTSDAEHSLWRGN